MTAAARRRGGDYLEFDAFSAGVEPGGLRNTKDIGILICYMLDHVGEPFEREDLIGIIQENGIANYFEAVSALEELIKCGNVNSDDNSMLSVTRDGKMISNQLSGELSLFIKQKAVSSMLRLVKGKKLASENPVTITQAGDGGYNVNMRITNGNVDLMSLTVFVPDRSDAKKVKALFEQDPDRLYTVLLASATGENEIVKKALLLLDEQ